MTKLPPTGTYRLEARGPAGTDLISRGETLESGLAALVHFVRVDAYGGERRFAPHGGHRLVLVPEPAAPLVADELLAEADQVLGEDPRYQVWLHPGNTMGRIKQGGPSDPRAANARRQRLRARLLQGSSDWYTVEVAR